MSLHRRCLLALGALPLFLAAGVSGPAQDAPSRPSATTDLRPKEPLTRTGARRTAIVSAIERVKGATVNIHSERTVASGGDLYTLSPS